LVCGGVDGRRCFHVWVGVSVKRVRLRKRVAVHEIGYAHVLKKKVMLCTRSDMYTSRKHARAIEMRILMHIQKKEKKRKESFTYSRFAPLFSIGYQQYTRAAICTSYQMGTQYRIVSAPLYASGVCVTMW
jgi:hypothetical protein